VFDCSTRWRSLRADRLLLPRDPTVFDCSPPPAARVVPSVSSWEL
jgi:hypothetical protein